MDDKLFNCILSDNHHVLYQLLPPQRHCVYTLRPGRHELCLINKSRLDDKKLHVQTTLQGYVLNWTVINQIFVCYFISFIYFAIYVYCVLCMAAYWQLFIMKRIYHKGQRSKIKVRASRRGGESIHVDAEASKSLSFCYNFVFGIE